jgi:hypothetical protein
MHIGAPRLPWLLVLTQTRRQAMLGLAVCDAKTKAGGPAKGIEADGLSAPPAAIPVIGVASKAATTAAAITAARLARWSNEIAIRLVTIVGSFRGRCLGLPGGRHR